jgi:hypothetical protein
MSASTCSNTHIRFRAASNAPNLHGQQASMVQIGLPAMHPILHGQRASMLQIGLCNLLHSANAKPSLLSMLRMPCVLFMQSKPSPAPRTCTTG